MWGGHPARPKKLIEYGAIGELQKLVKSTQYYQEKAKMQKHVCTTCAYVYDPELGDPDGDIAPGTPFEDIPEDWVCPICGVAKSDFEPE